jgi:hypothetical protein
MRISANSILRSATKTDIPDLVRMRTALQQQMFQSESMLFQISSAWGDERAKFYLACLGDARRLVLIVHDATGQSVGMGMGAIVEHSNLIPPKSGRLDDVCGLIQPNGGPAFENRSYAFWLHGLATTASIKFRWATASKMIPQGRFGESWDLRLYSLRRKTLLLIS